MSVLKDYFKKVFLSSKPEDDYDFYLPENANSDAQTKPHGLYCKSIYDVIDKNIDFLKISYNSLINSDIVLREFDVNFKNKIFKALLVSIDGMTSTELMNHYILKPLMMLDVPLEKQSPLKATPIKFGKENTMTVQKFGNENSKTDERSSHLQKSILEGSTPLEDYLFNLLIPQNSITKASTFETVISNVNSGSCALFVDTLSTAFIVDVKAFETRSVSQPVNETVIRGAQEGFVEKLRTNTSLLRRVINNEKLIIENPSVGKISNKKVAICYIKDIANDYLISEVKYRINNLDVDYLISSGQLEQLIQDNSLVASPQIIATERPDKAGSFLLEGRVAIILDGSPYVLVVPAVISDFLSSPEDMNLKFQYSNLLKIIRLIACFFTLLLPGLYVAITNYHSELLPTGLLFTIAATREAVPFPVIFEILLMELSFELIREAGLRVPNPIGPTIGIVGALVLGDAAVSASLVSPILIIVVGITGICSFAVPDFSLGFSLRISRFLYIILGYAAGFLGIAAGLFIQFAVLANLKSFGVSYLSPYLPPRSSYNSISSYFLHPIWKREKRSEFLNSR